MNHDRRKQTAAWLLFGAILLMICVLSFQSGGAARALDGPLVYQLTGQTERDAVSETVNRIIFYVRQTGRAVLFSMLGGSWGLAAWLSFQRWSGRGRLICAAAVLLAISWFTEWAKIFIEGRHYEFAEFVESFLCCILGYLLVTGLLRWRRSRCAKQEDIR